VKKTVTFLSGILVAIAGWVILQKFEIRGREALHRAGTDLPSPADPNGPSNGLPPTRANGTIRIATFNIQVFGDSKAKKPRIMDILARIVRQFDVVAVQEVRSKTEDFIPSFVDLVNAGGRHYDYVVGPRLGRADSTEQYAYLFDRATIEVDRTQLYTVADPDDLLLREPLVAWFRVRGPPPDQAFTFSLINVHTNEDDAENEVDVLANVYRAVRGDGRQEDDIIILGDLSVDAEHLGRLGLISGMKDAVAGIPTDTRGTQQLDHILFVHRATSEFSGRGGVFDFLREYNLTLEEAVEVSDHLPVWAEFSAYEGGQPGGIAARPRPQGR
jgi:deoxyribonuclease-1-like protein